MHHYLEQKDEQKLLHLCQKTDFTLNNINDLLDNLLNWAVANNQEIKVEAETIQIKKLLEKTVLLYKSNFENRGVHFEQNVEEAELVLDSNMISSVLRNIISNAIKHSPRNAVVTLDGQIMGDYYKVSVLDQGPGINQEVLDSLFSEKDRPLRRGGEDSFGLGLYLTLYFVNRNRGKLQISNQSPGTLVEVFLPLKFYNDI